jgi:formylglycine-generating enzyme required for sulfatase activity
MPKIFISYRRADSADSANRIYDRLTYAFGRENLFKDVDNLQRGDDFPEVLKEQIAQSDVVLAIIGTRWPMVQEADGKRRLDNPKDWVRQEIHMALERGKDCTVIPVLVDGGALPNADSLPTVLRPLATRDAQRIRENPHFHDDVSAMITSIRRRFGLVDAAPVVDVFQAVTTLDEVLEAKDYDAARDILARIRSVATIPAWTAQPIDALEQQLYAAVQESQRAKDYTLLKILVRRLGQEQKVAAVTDFWQTYPGYDPDHLIPDPTPDPLAIATPPTPQIARLPTSLEVMPKPFAWVDIPAGKVTLTEGGYVPKGGQTFDLLAFSIAKYPVTNAQFAGFIGAGGYNDKGRKWWTAGGLQAKDKENWMQPRYWDDAKWNQPDHPVVGVSWYEAVAFCAWLREVTGENINLPTDQQWQRAAQGDDGRDYPWGQNWISGRCNNSVSPEESSQTTLVTYFEGKDEGDSLFGVSDMAGNVWEWCVTDFNSGSSKLDRTVERVLRGGSWLNNLSGNFRCVYRNWATP